MTDLSKTQIKIQHGAIFFGHENSLSFNFCSDNHWCLKCWIDWKVSKYGCMYSKKMFNDVIRHRGQGGRTNYNKKVENSLCKLPLNWVCQDSNNNGFIFFAINYGLNTKGVSICRF
jgi:hypothetical protein